MLIPKGLREKFCGRKWFRIRRSERVSEVRIIKGLLERVRQRIRRQCGADPSRLRASGLVSDDQREYYHVSTVQVKINY